jgi:predicted nucleotidyltransferase
VTKVGRNPIFPLVFFLATEIRSIEWRNRPTEVDVNIIELQEELSELLNNNPELFELQIALSASLSLIDDPMERIEYITSEMMTTLRVMNLILNLTSMELKCNS